MNSLNLRAALLSVLALMLVSALETVWWLRTSLPAPTAKLSLHWATATSSVRRTEIFR